MPIYEYVCKSCGFEKEELQRLSDAPLVLCPGCNKPEFARKISAAGFRLKGGGWYETDFKTGKKKNLAADKAPDNGGGSPPVSKADSNASAKTTPANSQK